MVEKSRIRVNPQSREIEIEGSEKFVKTYFKIIEKMLSEDEKKIGGVSRRGAGVTKSGKKTAAKAERKGRGAKAARKRMKRGDISSTLVELIKASNGITTGELVKKSGLAEQQVRSVIYRAQKLGQITKQKRGVYVAA
jgi:hypothetical protein